VPTPTGVLWEREPHTAAKHAVYCRYFQAWFPILLSRFRQGVTYVEGFSGPGEYLGGHLGSPLIAVQAALASRTPPSADRPVYLLLVEENAARLAHLRGLLAAQLGDLEDRRALRARGFVVDPQPGRCDEVVPGLLTRHQAAR
jgi:three-Cys-motif partner protein